MREGRFVADPPRHGAAAADPPQRGDQGDVDEAEDRQRQEEEMQKAQKLAEIREQITEAGLSLDDLVSEQPKRKRGRPPKNAK